ncbi:MAG: VWA domain-containing protein [Spirochaetes bacterium]|nr:VWA domain-containing protein [Spirochaetota bacterium]
MKINLLVFILIIPLIIVLKIYFVDEKNYEGIFTTINIKNEKKRFYNLFGNYFFYIFFILSNIFLIIGLSNPKKPVSSIPVESKGKAIVFCIDVSSSMMALDFGDISRLDIAKNFIIDFIKKRPFDYYSVVIFAKNAFIYVPLTFDNQFVIERVSQIKIKMLDDGTAIGYGIMLAIDQIKDFEGSGKVIILFSDGNNNSGLVSPEDAAIIAKKNNILIFPIALGKQNEVSFPFKDKDGKIMIKKIDMPINFSLLYNISKITGSNIVMNPFDNLSLKNTLEKIDKLNSVVYQVQLFTYYLDNYLLYFYISYILFSIFLFLFLIYQKVEY